MNLANAHQAQKALGTDAEDMPQSVEDPSGTPRKNQ
jgi:hypothetical protein